MEEINSVENMTCMERWEELGLFSLEKRKFKCLGCFKDSDDWLSLVSKTIDDLMLQQGKFRLYIR